MSFYEHWFQDESKSSMDRSCSLGTTIAGLRSLLDSIVAPSSRDVEVRLDVSIKKSYNITDLVILIATCM